MDHRDIFVSYIEEDGAIVRALAAELRALGHSTWTYEENGVAGTSYLTQINHAIEDCRVFVLVASDRSVHAHQVVREVEQAHEREKVIVPVRFGLTHPQFIASNPILRMASGTVVTLSIEKDNLSEVAKRITSALAPKAEVGGPTRPVIADAVPARRRVALTALMFALAAAAGAAGGFWYWDAYYRVRLEYFANVTKRDGLPEGVGQLDASTVAKRNVSLALVRHGRRSPVDEVRLVNSSGHAPPTSSYVAPFSFADLNPLRSSVFKVRNPLGADAAVTKVTFTRDASGRVLEQSGWSAGGRAVYTLHYGSPETAEYKRQGFASPIRESGIVYLKFTRPPDGPHAGLDEKVSYLDASQRPQPDESGEYGQRVVFDERGLRREVVSLGSGLEDSPNNYGVLRSVHVFDWAGNVTEASTLGQNGEPVLGQTGAAGARMQYDEAGNLVRGTFFDRNGAPVTDRDVGAASFVYTYDGEGRLTSLTLLGPDQRPVIGRLLGGYAKQTLDWSAPSRSIRRFFGPSEEPLPVLGDAFEVILTWDEKGLVVEETYRNARGQPTRIDNGCSTIKMAYDAVGNVAELRCLDEGRAPALLTSGSSIIRMTSDERGNPLTTSYFNRADKPGVEGEKYSVLQLDYTDAGNIAKVTFLDARGTPCRIREGYAGYTRTYDTHGNLVRQEYFDENGRPVVIAAGYGAYVAEYDQRNREIRRSFLGTDGRPSITEDGYAVLLNKRDESGFVQSTTYLDPGERPVKTFDGYAGTRTKRDQQGRAVEVTYLDERGQPVITARPGSARRRFTYDSGRLVERADVDIAGIAMTNAYGYSSMRYAYDEFGRETTRQVLDLNGRVLSFRIGIDKVARASVAAETGFRAGDIILTYDGEAVTSRSEFNRLELFKGDRPRSATVQRGGQVVAVDLPAGRMSGLTLEERAVP